MKLEIIKNEAEEHDKPFVCKYCERRFAASCNLGKHLTQTHKANLKEYYDTYIDPGPHLCKECGKELEFKNMVKGYDIFCSQKCWGVNNGKNEETKRKREETCLKKYGVKQFLASDRIQRLRVGDDNPSKRPEVIAKIRATKELHFGNANYNNMEKTIRLKKNAMATNFSIIEIRIDKL